MFCARSLARRLQIQQKLRAIIPSPDVLLQMNECLRVAPQIIPPPPPAVPPPELQEELRSHMLGGGGWRAVQQQRRVARGLAAAAAAAAASAPPRTFRPREVQEVRTRSVQDILGYSFNDIRLMRSSLIHSCAPSPPAAHNPLTYPCCVLRALR